MTNKVSIYLAGTIKKSHERSDELFWTDEDMAVLRKQLAPLEVSFLNPAFRTDDLSDQLSVFGRDMLQVFCSDVVFVDARNRRGLGVGAEMMWAKRNCIPVLIWAPEESHYHMKQATILGVNIKNYIHPFVESLGDKLVETLEEGALWIKSLYSANAPKIRGMDYMEKAMQHYLEQQLAHDTPMQELMNANEQFKARAEGLRAFNA